MTFCDVIGGAVFFASRAAQRPGSGDGLTLDAIRKCLRCVPALVRLDVLDGAKHLAGNLTIRSPRLGRGRGCCIR